MPKLELICEFATLNGGERSMLAVLGYVVAAGFDVRVIAPPSGPLADELRRRGIEVAPLMLRDDTDRRLPQARLREQLAELLQRRRADLVHANSLAMGRLSGPVVDHLGLSSLAHLRDIIRLSRQAIVDLNRHTRLAAVSEATRRFHVAAGLDAAKTHVLHNGVDLAQFSPREPSGFLHRELGIPVGTQLVGVVGQIGLRKGQDVLLAAAASLALELPDMHLVIVGERHSQKAESVAYEADLHQTAEAHIPGRVHFLGYRHDMDRLYSELSLLVHTARQEPLGRVLLEAAAAGLAIIATEVGGTSEIFPPDRAAARLVPAGDPAETAGAMREILTDSALRRRLGIAARRRAAEAFGVDRAAAALLGHYREILRMETA